MQLKLLLYKWGRMAGLLLVGGSLAWAAKLAVIIATNGRIITTGAASLLMKVGLLLLLAGALGVGSRLGNNQKWWVRFAAFLFAPVLVFGPLILVASFVIPLVPTGGIWYARQEMPIAFAVIVYLVAGYFLHTRDEPARIHPQMD